MNTLIESKKLKKVDGANAYISTQFAQPFYYRPSHSNTDVRSVALFWSVFGPAARCNFRNPDYIYAALMKP